MTKEEELVKHNCINKATNERTKKIKRFNSQIK